MGSVDDVSVCTAVRGVHLILMYAVCTDVCGGHLMYAVCTDEYAVGI